MYWPELAIVFLDLLSFSESPSGHLFFDIDKVINNCFGYILTRADEPHDKLQYILLNE